jgi:NAD-dependent deacetylase
MKRKNIVVLSGAGISAESGLSTFRDSGGLWDKYEIYDVATPEAWARDQNLVQGFYNARRKQCGEVKPNIAHLLLAELEDEYDVQIITQNVDDLHERAGSSNVLHLHGMLTKARSTINENLVYDIGYKQLTSEDLCPEGSQLRPHIVWFGEAVPEMENAEKIVQNAEVLIIVGTSLNVYPAAGLYQSASANCPIYVVDPNEVKVTNSRFTIIKEIASVGIASVKDQLKSK